jgi:surfactin synthase thioesterase subunit
MNAEKIKLLALPYAGGSVAAYLPMKKYLKNYIEFIPMEYPGRGSRRGVRFYESIEEAARDTAERASSIDGQYAIFGHSLGGLIGYEACRLLAKMGNRMPLHLFISGKQPPHIKLREKEIHRLPDHEFRDKILEMGGTPDGVLDHPELAEYYLPILRADFMISEKYVFKRTQPPLSINLTVLGGDQDEIKPLHLAAWKDYIAGEFKVVMLSGDHFFINHNFEAVAEIINHTIRGKR